MEADQYSFGPDGEINNPPEEKSMYVDEQGRDVTDEVFQVSKLDFLREDRNSSEMITQGSADLVLDTMLESLMAEQRDKPFKKGGESISFRPLPIILNYRLKLTKKENALFDIILAYISSHPTFTSYTIYISDLAENAPYKNKKNVYSFIRDTYETLIAKIFEVEKTSDDGKKKAHLKWLLFESMMYVNNIDNPEEGACLSFIPTKFLRVLAISSGKYPGAHYNWSIPFAMSGKYVTNLFYYLEAMKNYREYPNATTGRWKVSLDDFKELMGLGKTTRWSTIEERVFTPAEQEINNNDQVDIVFQYRPIKERKRGLKPAITGISFIVIKRGEYIASTNYDDIKKMLKDGDVGMVSMDMILKGNGFSEKDRLSLLSVCVDREHTAVTLSSAIMEMQKVENRKSDYAVLKAILERL